MKTKRILISVLVIAIALEVGFYFGKNGLPLGQEATVLTSFKSDVPVPADLPDMSQFFEIWNTLNARHPSGQDVTPQEKIWGAIGGLVDSIDDPYTVFLPPEENERLNIDLKGEFSGVGMEVGLKDSHLTVISPLKDSPAEKAGILPGDIVLKIDDTVTDGLDIDEAVGLIRGPKGSAVNLTIFRQNESTARVIAVTRDVIKIPVLETENLKSKGVFVIRLFSFGESATREFKKALEEFQASGDKKLVLDLRNNPGGFLDAAVDIGSWFLEPGKTIVIEKSKDATQNHEYKSRGHQLVGNYKMAVLVNSGSASASEILAGALKEHHVATIVGTQTFGKGSVQELMPMKDETALKITIAEWQTPSGHSISKEGLTPDVIVEFDSEKFKKDGTDNQLQKAIEALK